MQVAKREEGLDGTTGAGTASQQTSPPKSATTKAPPIMAWTAEDYIAREFPPKEPLLKGLLHRRDLVAFGARRRGGKTTMVTNIGVALALPVPDFLGYAIPQARRSLLFILEDDPGEYQEQLRRVIAGRDTGGRIRIVTREEFHQRGIRIDVGQSAFQDAARYWANEHRPDVIVFDNVAQLVAAEYNDANRVHELMQFSYELARKYDAAIILPAHPKKEDPNNRSSLLDDPNAFFESIMGSSHFINSTGCLWGLERQPNFDRSAFLGGRQRADGHQGASLLGMNDDGWFYLLDEAQGNSPLVLNTPVRCQAWALLPEPPASFAYNEGQQLVKTAMRSGSTYHAWMKDCRRLKVILDTQDGKLCKTAGVRP
jgi:hypothetical protein